MNFAKCVGAASIAFLAYSPLAEASLDRKVVEAVECFRDKGTRVTSSGHGLTMYEWLVLAPNYKHHRVVYSPANPKTVGEQDTITFQWKDEDYFRQGLGGEGLSERDRERFYKSIMNLGDICHKNP